MSYSEVKKPVEESKKQQQQKKRKNEDVREETRPQVSLPETTVEVSAVKKVPAARQKNKRSEALEAPVDMPICVVSNMKENLLCNKTIGANRLILLETSIRQRGMRGYLYYVPDQGFAFWSYRPLGTHQAH